MDAAARANGQGVESDGSRPGGGIVKRAAEILVAVIAFASSCSSSHEPALENVGGGASSLGNCNGNYLHPQAVQSWGTTAINLPGNPALGSISVVQYSNGVSGSWAGFATLTLVYRGATTVTCTYTAHNGFPGEVPVFTFGNCDNGAVYGQTILGNEVDLTLSTPDSNAFADFVLPYSDDDKQPCTQDSCAGRGGVVAHNLTALNGTIPSPTDGDLCSTELCSGGTIAKTAISLNESNPCVTVTCDSAKGIVETPIPGCGVPSNVSSISDSTVVTDFASATSFVYSSGNQPGRTTAIDPNRVSILRGQVLQAQPVNNNTCPNTPCAAGQECMADSLCHAGLTNVTVSILNGSGYGSTLTRPDGWFDIAVNGGAPVVLQYSAGGYLPVQRRVDTTWRDYSFAPDVVMIPRAAGAVISLPVASGGTTLSGTSATDADGTRTTRAFLPAGLNVTNQGFTRSSLTFRLTEYTVGPLGPKAMPGDLPPSSAYTYAFEASMDEAETANIPSVTFNSPISLYVENFLNLPVGAIVPMGSYDRTTATWKVEQNGQVINVFGKTNDVPARAQVSIDPNALTTEIANYNSIGMTDDERRKLAATYQSLPVQLWRAQVTHFTPFDENMPPANDGPAPTAGAPVPNTPRPDPCTASGSIIECENQILAEELPIVGTPYSLRYQSERSRGMHPTITIPITGSTAWPTNLKRVDVEIAIAGSRSYLSYPASSLTLNESVTWAWNRLDGYGRFVQGTQPGRVTVVWVYDDGNGSQTQGSQSATSFGGFGTGTKIGKDRTMRETYGRKSFPIVLQAFDALPLGFGGWSLSAEHVYEPFGHSTWLGDGRRFTEAARTQRLTTAATHPVANVTYTGMAFGADGTMYTTGLQAGLAPSGYVFSMSNGMQTQLSATFNSSNNIFTNGMYLDQLALGSAMGIAVSPDGSLYIADQFRIIKASPPNGGGRRTLTLIAGSTSNVPASTAAPDGAVAAGTPIGVNTGDPLDLYPTVGQVALAPDGTIYFAALDPGGTRPGRVRRIRTDGLLDTVAGTGSAGQPISGCDNSTCSAKQQPFSQIYGVALGTDGSIYFSENNSFGSGNRVWRVSSDGILHPFAGGGSTSGAPSGVLANSVTLRGVHQLAFANSSLYFAESGTAEVNRRVDQGGYITTVGGRVATNSTYTDNVPPQLAYFMTPTTVGLGPDGALYSNGHDYSSGVIGRIQRTQGPQDLIDQDGSWLVPSDDGQEVYKFDTATGRHTATRTATRGTTLQTLHYTSGLLDSIVDALEGTTTFARSGSTVTITAPHGQITKLACGGSCTSSYLTTFTDPNSKSTTLAHNSAGLLTSLTDPNSNLHTFMYDGNGYLTKDLNPLPGSGGTLMSRTSNANGWTTSLTTPEGRTGKTDTVDFTPSGLRSEGRKHFSAVTMYSQDDRNLDGSRTVTTYGANSSVLSSTAWTTTVDPRYSLSLPFTTSVTSVNGSHSSTRTNTRAVVGGSPTNPFTFQTITDSSSVTTGVPTGPFSSKLDVTTNPATMTISGATTTLMENVDTYDRPTEIDPQGVRPNGGSLYPTTLSYVGSRLSQTSQGVGLPNDPSRRTYTLHYNGPHAELSSIDTPLGGSTISFSKFDADGRPTQELLPGGRTMTFAYDANGNRTTIQEPIASTTHSFTPNQVNLLSLYTPPSPLNGSTTYVYDRDQLLTQLLAPAAPITYAYDSMGRLSTVTYTNPATSTTLVSTWNYDTSLTSQPAQVTTTDGGAASSTLYYVYDGTLTSAAQETFPSVSAVFFIKAFDANQRVSLRYLEPNPGGSTDIGYAYDTDGRVSQITNAATGATYTLNYQPQNGLLASTVFSANSKTVTETYSYDAYGALGETRTMLNSGQILDFAYGRNDPLNRITSKLEQNSGFWHSWTYNYSAAYQFFLSSFDLSDNGVSRTFDYDADGNFTTYFGAPFPSQSYDLQDRMLTHPWGSYGYDANGAVYTQNGTPTFWYDALGNLRKVGSNITYNVDPQNRRLGKYSSGTLVDGWLYDGDRIIAQVNSGGQLVGQFVYATKSNVPDLMFAKTASGWDAWRILSDQIGSVRALVHMLDGVTTYFDYRDPWGPPNQTITYGGGMNPPKLPFGFAGGLYDYDTGLYRFGARDYNPWLGRWWSKDPIRFGGGDNLYMYCNNDPVNCIDPNGLAPDSPTSGPPPDPGPDGGDVCKPRPTLAECLDVCLKRKASADIACWGLYTRETPEFDACTVRADKARSKCVYECPKAKGGGK